MIVMNDDNRYSRDDLIPMLKDASVSDDIGPWLKYNASEGFLIELVQMRHGIMLLTNQLRQLLSDLIYIGSIPGGDINGLPAPTLRPAAPTGIGVGNGNVWANFVGTTYTARFYVNGVHKLTLTSYYITSLDSIGAVSGDIVQICQVSDTGIPGWWTRIKVP